MLVSVGLSMCPLSLLGNNSVKTFPRQRRIAGGVVFYAVRVVSRKVGYQFFPELLIFYLCSRFYFWALHAFCAQTQNWEVSCVRVVTFGTTTYTKVRQEGNLIRV
jgi:hypothetical protein